MNILIVDDSKLNVKIAYDALEEHSIQAEISMCYTGEEAIDFIEKNQVDIVLLDIIMPGISGMDVLKIMNMKNYIDRTKVIMLTNVDDLQVLRDCFELGATDYLRKPFEKSELAARVKSVLDELMANRTQMNTYLEEVGRDLLTQIEETLDVETEMERLLDSWMGQFDDKEKASTLLRLNHKLGKLLTEMKSAIIEKEMHY